MDFFWSFILWIIAFLFMASAFAVHHFDESDKSNRVIVVLGAIGLGFLVAALVVAIGWIFVGVLIFALIFSLGPRLR